MQISKLIFLSSVLCALTFTANAQEAVTQTTPVKGEKLHLMNISEEHYEDLRNIHTLTKYANITYAGVDSSLTSVNRYQLTANNDHVKLKALYNKRGRLIGGVMVKTNTKLPGFIYRILSKQDSTANWSMVSNKTVVIDFNPRHTQYKIVLQKDNKQKAYFFNSQGGRIDGLTDVPKFDSLGETNLALVQ